VEVNWTKCLTGAVTARALWGQNPSGDPAQLAKIETALTKYKKINDGFIKEKRGEVAIEEAALQNLLSRPDVKPLVDKVRGAGAKASDGAAADQVLGQHLSKEQLMGFRDRFDECRGLLDMLPQEHASAAAAALAKVSNLLDKGQIEAGSGEGPKAASERIRAVIERAIAELDVETRVAQQEARNAFLQRAAKLAPQVTTARRLADGAAGDSWARALESALKLAKVGNHRAAFALIDRVEQAIASKKPFEREAVFEAGAVGAR
jgi:hypothetical protein